RLVATLTPRVELAYHRLAGWDDEVEIAYVSSVAGPEGLDRGSPAPAPATLAQALRERLVADRGREVERGLTLSGPHRDDLSLGLRELPARTPASPGEGSALGP